MRPTPATTVKTDRPVRSDSRAQELLDAAARLFAKRGYASTSMRDIALAVNMLAGSVYYHFASKEELLVAVYSAGVKHLEGFTHAAVEREVEPWARLEALCRSHLEAVLKNSDYAQVLIRVVPDDVPAAADRLRALRAKHEALFRTVIADLPLRAGTDQRALRLMLIGALNWTLLWFDPQGRDSPRVLARKFVGLLREGQDESTSA